MDPRSPVRSKTLQFIIIAVNTEVTSYRVVAVGAYIWSDKCPALLIKGLATWDYNFFVHSYCKWIMNIVPVCK